MPHLDSPSTWPSLNHDIRLAFTAELPTISTNSTLKCLNKFYGVRWCVFPHVPMVLPATLFTGLQWGFSFLWTCCTLYIWRLKKCTWEQYVIFEPYNYTLIILTLWSHKLNRCKWNLHYCASSSKPIVMFVWLSDQTCMNRMIVCHVFNPFFNTAMTFTHCCCFTFCSDLHLVLLQLQW